jgi:hypothetical protein
MDGASKTPSRVVFLDGSVTRSVTSSQSRLAVSCIRSTSKLRERMIVYSFYCLTLSHLNRSAKGKYSSFLDLSSSFSRAFNCNESVDRDDCCGWPAEATDFVYAVRFLQPFKLAFPLLSPGRCSKCPLQTSQDHSPVAAIVATEISRDSMTEGNFSGFGEGVSFQRPKTVQDCLDVL